MPRKPVILHVDDDSLVRELVVDTLAGAGMEVRNAGDVLAGIQLALKERPDLILLDIHMPGADGYEACLAFRAVDELSAIPIIMLTGMKGPEHSDKALSYGAAEYIAKPFKPARLVSAIKKRLSLT